MTIHRVDDHQALLVSASDRCFNYGDGCFTTMYVNQGTIELFSAHMSRLQWCCERLFISGICFETLRATLVQFCQQFAHSTVVKVLISRGVGGRGYQLPQDSDAKAQIYISHSVYPTSYYRLRAAGIGLAVSTVKVGINPHLAGVKHCNRLEQVLIKQAMQGGCDDVVVLDVDNHMVECSASNLFWCRDGRWFTPTLQGSGVKGVMRELVIEVIKAQHLSVDFVDVGLTHLLDADGVLSCNALTGAIKVNTLDYGAEQLRAQSHEGEQSGCHMITYDSADVEQLINAIDLQLLSRADAIP